MRLVFDVVVGEDLEEPRPEPDYEALSAATGDFLASAGLDSYPGLRVCLSYVSENGIRLLNHRYRKMDEPTDVLSFPLWEEEGRFSPPEGWEELPLGDVVLCPRYIRESARRENMDYNGEIILALVHGILHLTGFDHDSEERKRAMWDAQAVVVGAYFDRKEETIRGGLMSE